MSKTIYISYNDSVNDIIRAYLFKSASESVGRNFIVFINDSKIKTKTLSSIGINHLVFNKKISFFYFIGGIYFLIFYKNFRLNFHVIKNLFNSFVISRNNRKSSVYNLSIHIFLINFINFLFLYSSFVFIFAKYIFYQGVNQIICEERSKIPESIFFQLALINSLDYIQFTNGPLKSSLVVKRFDSSNSNSHPLSISNFNNLFNTLDPNYNFQDDVIHLIESRYTHNNWYDRNRIEKRFFTNNISDVINTSNNIISIFPHIFWDATFSYGKNIFSDYKVWFDETCDYLSRFTNLHIVIKSHPDLTWKSTLLSQSSFNHEHYFKDTVDKYNKLPLTNSKFYLLGSNSDISALSLIKHSKAIITVRGTDGLESSCFGVPCITGGSGRYSNYGFTIDSDNRDQYFNKLDLINDLDYLSIDQIRKARYLAYLLFFKKSIFIQSFDTYRFSDQYLQSNFLSSFITNNSINDDIKRSKLDIFLNSKEYDLFN